MSMRCKFIEMGWSAKLFKQKDSRFTTISIVAAVGGFVLHKAEAYEFLDGLAAVILLPSLVGLPILLWLNAPEGRGFLKKLLSLWGYSILYSIFFIVGACISYAMPLGTYEKQLRVEENAKMEADRKAELERFNAEQAEKKRLQEIENKKAAREKQIADQRKRAIAEQGLKYYELTMSVKQISEAFDRNSARAEDQLKGKRIKVFGYAGIIDDGPFREDSIYFRITDGEWLGGEVVCNMKRSNKSYQRFDKGQPVIMIGRLSGEELGVRFDDCYFP